MLKFFAFHKDTTEDITQNFKLFKDLDLSLYKNKSRKTQTHYIINVWGVTILRVVMLLFDIYTCIKLLAFNTWSNEYIPPFVPFRISKWLFSACIFVSILVMACEFVAGIRIYRTENISFSFMNNWTNTFRCLRDYRVYCLFEKITPSGVFQRMAFFTYFELKSSFKLLFADSPRQIINGLTLWSVLFTRGSTSEMNLGDLESLQGVGQRMRWIAKNNHEEAVILSFMFSSFLIWVFFFLKLTVAVVLSLKIHHKLVYEWRFTDLKGYVCITISYNIDYLTEKYRFKQFYSQVSPHSSDEFSIDSIGEDGDLKSMGLYDSEEMSRISFLKTPDTLNTLPSYYYQIDDKKSREMGAPYCWEFSVPAKTYKKQGIVSP
ncbi:pheromone-regulated K(+) transporter PRM6 KNAG_0G00370 [Huiozyma naganishii CBS 8797]|uniref:Uncharacterized protein n=1 Tax=Huiozyma naganishii (strain ATCC MYA-139 / BCRC 22969 / CBS 8797 / KCTC 17520 / NBRC 10181 / NCYC 3082 / Yp74L-3) TaxID=1071383 RepID=J7S7Q0_HUIN7|nr:hypothetical protein KNAG_0G00370 [Kazachstania naganishii CBS 8797]CCK71094.1 hypothetical protein KNAG_0G00370 [Kazachstania naganishii CBS 8797]